MLLKKGLSSSKHSGVRALFNQHFIKPGLFDVSIGKFYSELFDKRQEGDYEDFFTLSKEEAEKFIDDATSFIKQIKEKIKEI